jgi:hypothetical protein
MYIITPDAFTMGAISVAVVDIEAVLWITQWRMLYHKAFIDSNVLTRFLTNIRRLVQFTV